MFGYASTGVYRPSASELAAEFVSAFNSLESLPVSLEDRIGLAFDLTVLSTDLKADNGDHTEEEE